MNKAEHNAFQNSSNEKFNRTIFHLANMHDAKKKNMQLLDFGLQKKDATNDQLASLPTHPQKHLEERNCGGKGAFHFLKIPLRNTVCHATGGPVVHPPETEQVQKAQHTLPRLWEQKCNAMQS